MAIQYPTFRADPNAMRKPDYSAISNLLPNVMRGYQLAKLPEQMEQQKQAFQAQQALRRAQAQEAMQKAQREKMLSNMLSQSLQPQGGGGQPMGGAPQGQAGMQGGAGGDLGQQLFRHLVGLPSETPQEKEQREMRQFEQKEDIRRKEKQEEAPLLTRGARTQFQQQSAALKQIIPELKELKNITPSKLSVAGRYSWERKKKILIDKIMAAQKLGKNIPALENVKDILERGTFESTDHYKKDIDSFIDDLDKIQSQVDKTIETGKIQPLQQEKKPRYTVNDPDVLDTAQKYNMTPQQVVKQLNERL